MLRHWLSARGGNGAEEITAGIRQVRKFLEMHGSSRFEAAWEPGPKLPAGEAPIEKVVNRAGFRKLEGSDADKCWEFFILPEAWRSEVCRGLDATAIAKHMVDKGWITAGEGRHLGCKTRVPGHGPIRVFRIASAFLAVDDEADLKGDGQSGNDQAGDDQ
jgi:putative DNA primase/helicase